VPASVLPLLHGWRRDFAQLSPSSLAQRLGGSSGLRGAPVPAGTRVLRVPAMQKGAPLLFSLALATPGADSRVVALRRQGRDLVAHLSATRPGEQVVALLAQLPHAAALSAAHAQAEGGITAPAASGLLTLGPLRTGNGQVVTRWNGWKGHRGLRGSGSALRYAVGNDAVAVLRRPQVTDTRPLPVLATPAVARSAGPGGILRLSFDGQPVTARVAAVIHRFPTTQDDGDVIVVADEGALAAALTADDPGAAGITEVWLGLGGHAPSPQLERALRSPPFSELATSSRRSILGDLAGDPLAKGITRTLLAAAALALLLALAGVVLTTASALRDERAELFDLEAQGVAPAELRGELRLRAAAVVTLGVVLGVVVGLVLARAVVALVLVSANDSPPTPPLVAATSWWPVIGALAVFALVALAASELVVRRSFHERVPRRPSGAAP
jgi:hypothetical protein